MRPFLLIPGEEVSDEFVEEATSRRYVVHVNGLGTTHTVGKQGGTSVRDVMQRVVNAINEAGGFPHVNHPNFHWSLTADDLYSMRDLRHFEIYNGHPRVHNFGGAGRPSMEEMWDALLSRGRLYFGVATDDAHHFKRWSRDLSNPGRGWVVVRAPELTAPAILAALRSGDFYASTGVELSDVSSGDRALRLTIAPKGDPDGRNEMRYTTWFIGRDGEVLKRDESLQPEYRLKPDDLYVRARVLSSNGEFAWTQPAFVDGKLRAE